MEVMTEYGLCTNVDVDHMVEYNSDPGTTDCFVFSEHIVDNPDGSYLMFGFEVWKDKDDEFHFFVEEGLKNGCAETHDTELCLIDKAEIKKMYYEYIRKH